MFKDLSTHTTVVVVVWTVFFYHSEAPPRGELFGTLTRVRPAAVVPLGAVRTGFSIPELRKKTLKIFVKKNFQSLFF